MNESNSLHDSISAIGGAIYIFMKERGYSIEKMSQLTGIDSRQLEGILSGEHSVTLDEVNKISSALGVDMMHFMERIGLLAVHPELIYRFSISIKKLHEVECLVGDLAHEMEDILSKE